MYVSFFLFKKSILFDLRCFGWNFVRKIARPNRAIFEQVTYIHANHTKIVRSVEQICNTTNVYLTQKWMIGFHSMVLQDPESQPELKVCDSALCKVVKFSFDNVLHSVLQFFSFFALSFLCSYYFSYFFHQIYHQTLKKVKANEYKLQRWIIVQNLVTKKYLN